MNFNTNQKINQVTENTLVIGIDIAKHYACAIDERGRVLQKSFPFSQSREGFDVFYEKLLALRTTHGKSEIEALDNLKELISAHQKTIDTSGSEELNARHRKLWNY